MEGNAVDSDEDDTGRRRRDVGTVLALPPLTVFCRRIFTLAIDGVPMCPGQT
jgi:hypothetical protein